MLDLFIEALDPYLGYDASGKLPESRGAPFYETDPVWDEVYPKIQRLEAFHSFFHDEHMLSLMRTVANAEVFVYPIKMARISTPGKIGYETPPHQDAYSHHAGPTMAGIWVALHDVSTEMGRVEVLPGSHKLGVRKVFQAQGVGGVQCEIFADETIKVNPTCVRIPVFFGHSEAVHIETRDKITAAAARKLLQNAPGIVVMDEPVAGGYPTPVTDAAGQDSVFVGRIR